MFKRWPKTCAGNVRGILLFSKVANHVNGNCAGRFGVFKGWRKNECWTCADHEDLHNIYIYIYIRPEPEPGVPGPGDRACSGNRSLFGFAAFGGEAKRPLVSGKCVARWPWYPGRNRLSLPSDAAKPTGNGGGFRPTPFLMSFAAGGGH